MGVSDQPTGENQTARLRRTTLDVEYPSVDAFLDDYVANISGGGTMIQIGREIAVDEPVELAMSFPGLLAPLRLRGQVRWVQHEGADDFSVGVELTGQPGEWDELAQKVQRIRDGDREVVTPILRVLIIEDNPHVAKLITDGLVAYRRRSGEAIAFAVRYATNGKEGLALLAERPFDLVLTDMYLPVMDGESLIAAMRGDASWKGVPIVAFSAGGSEAQERATKAGADFFLEKPVRLADLLNVVRKVLQRLAQPEPQGS